MEKSNNCRTFAVPKHGCANALTIENQYNIYMSSRSFTVKANEVEHPGVILDKVLKERGIKQKELSDAIGKSTPVINDIIKRRRSISPEIAYMLEVIIDDIPAVEWLSYQSQYDLAMIRKDEDVRRRRERLEEWNQLKQVFNASYLKKKLGLTGAPEDNIDKVYKFFGVSSVSALQDKVTDKMAYFHQSTTLSVDPANMMTWILMVRKKSGDQPALKTAFSTRQVGELIQRLNTVFYKNENTKERTEKVLNKYGIKFVIEENLERTPVDGYSFWDGENPTIAVSLRYKRLDNFAFAVMHELGHIVKHIKRSGHSDYIDIIKEDAQDPKEVEANEFALQALRADAPLNDFFEQWGRSPFTAKWPIMNTAQKYKISPSIITGLFQHYCGSYSVCRDLLATVN